MSPTTERSTRSRRGTSSGTTCSCDEKVCKSNLICGKVLIMKNSSLINITIFNDQGVEVEHEFPAKFEVCDRCEGHGTHLTPRIREHAYTAAEFYESFEDEESRAEYFKRGGAYDVTCESCKGQRVISVVDEAQLTEEQKSVFAQWLADDDVNV